MLHIRSLVLLILVAVKISSSVDAERTTTTNATEDEASLELSTTSPISDTSAAAENSMTSSSTRVAPQTVMNLTTPTSTTAEKEHGSDEKTDKVSITDTTSKTATTTQMVPTSKSSEKYHLDKPIKEELQPTTVGAPVKENVLLTPPPISSGEKSPTSVPATTEDPKASALLEKELNQESRKIKKELMNQPQSCLTKEEFNLLLLQLPQTLEKITTLIDKKKEFETTSTTKHSTYSEKTISNTKAPTSKPQPKTYLRTSSKENETKAIINRSRTTQTITLFKIVPFGANLEPPIVKDSKEEPLQINPFSKARIIERVCIAVVCILGFVALAALLALYFKARKSDRKRSKRAAESHEVEGLMKYKEGPV